jgi:uncharacterized membrane protein YkoI
MWAKSLLLSAFVAVGANTAPVHARPSTPVFQPDWVMPTQGRGENNRQQSIRPLREVVAELQARYGGELISARLEDGGRPIYVIRWRMPDGQVRDFRVNAAR